MEQFWAHLKRFAWVYILLIVVIGGNAWLVYQNFFSPRTTVFNNQNTPPATNAPAGTVASALNGDYIPEANAAIRPMAVMIDNLSAARPSAGLSEAAVVWETLAEGGVTRLMPIFQINDATAIGPVRSARDYYLPWADEVGAIYAHAGGSPAGLGALQGHTEIPDADQFKNGAAYYRNPNIAAPHNLFTTTAQLQTLATQKNWNITTTIAAWPVNDTTPTGASATSVTVDFSTSPYKVVWTWDDNAKVYDRVIGGAISLDRNTNQQITAKNVIVLAAQIDPAPDFGLSGAPLIAVEVHAVDSGEAWFFRDGVMVHGTWAKTAWDSRITFTADDGSSYSISRGATWIEVVDKAKKSAVTFK